MDPLHKIHGFVRKTAPSAWSYNVKLMCLTVSRGCPPNHRPLRVHPAPYDETHGSCTFSVLICKGLSAFTPRHMGMPVIQLVLDRNVPNVTC